MATGAASGAAGAAMGTDAAGGGAGAALGPTDAAGDAGAELGAGGEESSFGGGPNFNSRFMKLAYAPLVLMPW